MAKDIDEIIEQVKKEQNTTISNLNEAQQMLYYYHKKIEMENLAKKHGIKTTKIGNYNGKK